MDDPQNLDEIRRQTDSWIESASEEITPICDRLIAALFYFRPLHPLTGGVLDGEILCRLPPNLHSRQKLLKRMRQNSGSNLLKVQCAGKDVHYEDGLVTKSLTVGRGEELYIPVKLRGLPHGSAVTIDILMGSRLRDWFPISGSPYVLVVS